MDNNNYTQITLGVIGLIGIQGGAVIANWDKFKAETKQEPPVIADKNLPEASTTCQYFTGFKAGTTQYFPLSTPGLRPGLVGYPCTDGLGNYGVGIPDKR
jgi:hypothetical protein